MIHDDPPEIDETLLRRIYGEYLEMPGMQLTLAQASRLWNLQPAMSAQVMQSLVDSSLLRRAGDCYVLAGSGRPCV